MKQSSDRFTANELKHEIRPTELYHIWQEDGIEEWRYTNLDVDFQFGRNIYTAAAIKRETVQYNTKLEVSTLTIEISALAEPAIEYLSRNPLDVLWIQVIRVHTNQIPQSGSVIFVGQIKNVRMRGNTAQVECVGFENYLKQTIPIPRFGPSCNNTLYDARCGADKSLYKLTTTVIYTDDPTLLTSADFGFQEDGYYTRGYLVYEYHKPMIVSHTGNQIRIRYNIPGMASGATVDVYAGCDLSIETCLNRFDNVNNFFGHPYIPKDNPATKY